jgi:GNAT superfamily N-acetyltransferase
MRYFLPIPGIENLDRGDLVLQASTSGRGEVQQPRLADVDEAVDWVRRESKARGVTKVRWWLGWRSEPADLAERLLAKGFEWNEMPNLLGMTLQAAPPPGPDVEVRQLRTVEEVLEGVAVDWEVWELPEARREAMRERVRERHGQSTAVTEFAAYLDGRPVGFGRAIDMDRGVTLMGGSVLPELRGRGVYRALVRARWDHAVARGTPLLVVQAGPMSAPILARLGFETHGELRVLDDRE